MSRRSALAKAGIAVLIAAACATGARSDLTLVADDPANPLAATGAPEVVVHEAPPQLELRQAGVVRIKAGPPAAPGDAVYLNTAGAYNAGYVRVSKSVLGPDLSASLTVPGREHLGSYRYWASVPATASHGEGSSARFPIEIVSPSAPDRPSCGGTNPRKADGTHWVCTYDDEFNGDDLDRRYWVPQQTENSGFTTGTRVRYACALDGPQTISVDGGTLNLSLVDLGASRACGQNKSSQFAYGQVMHHQTFNQKYGKFEVRAKIPDLRVPGSQVSFWLWPAKDTYGPWPASGEIDFAEMYSNQPDIYKPFVHYLPGESTDGTNRNVTHADCAINPGEFNTYGLKWGPGQLVMLINGKVCMVNEYSSAVASGGAAAPFDQPFYLSLNQAMGTIGNEYDAAAVPDRLTTQIDYVRVWR